MDIRKALEDKPDAWTLKELEPILKMKTTTLYLWVRKGKIKGFKVGKKWCVAKEDVIAYLEGCLSEAEHHG